MSKIVRFGVSLDNDLLAKFDHYLHKKKYPNRSEAIRDLIRDQLVSQEWEHNKETVGTVTIVYDHHRPDLLRALTDFQHRFAHLIIANTHVHLDSHNCLEVVIVRGRSHQIQALANALVSAKGVKHGKLTLTTTAKQLR